MEIKQGDKVRVSRDIPQFYLEYNSYRMFEIEHRVVDVNMEDGFALLDSIPPKFTTILPTKYLVKVDAEAKEAFCVGDWVRVCSKDAAGFGKIGKIIRIYPNDCVDINFNDGYAGGRYYGIWAIEHCAEPTEQTEVKKKPNVGSIKIPVEVDLTDSYWDAYTADLAKEVALKVANKYNDPEHAAGYAVSVAKAVVEGLKRERECTAKKNYQERRKTVSGSCKPS